MDEKGSGTLIRHTSHVTRHTSRVTRHTSHVTRHTPPAAPRHPAAAREVVRVRRIADKQREVLKSLGR